MKENIKQIVACGAISMAVLVYGNACGLDGGTGSGATSLIDHGTHNPGTEIDISSLLGNSNPLLEGELNANVRYLDLVCTGRCKTGNAGSLELEIEAESKVPEMIKMENGKVVFTNPDSMCTIKMPVEQRTAKVKIHLEQVASKFLEGGCHYLLVKNKDAELAQLRLSSNEQEAGEIITMSGTDEVKLFPRINKTNGGVYDPVVAGEPVSNYDNDAGWGAGTLAQAAELNNGVVDFGAVYRVMIKIENEN